MTQQPIEIIPIDLAFGGKAMEILPAHADIPEEFKRHNNEFNKFISTWFYEGMDHRPQAAEGIDLNLALKNLKACLGDFAPKHEHKIAGCAYLASQWLVIE